MMAAASFDVSWSDHFAGGGARPMDLSWVRDLLAETDATGTAPFVKQLGSVWARDRHVGGKSVAAHGDIKGGRPEYWPADLRVREYPTTAHDAQGA